MPEAGMRLTFWGVRGSVPVPQSPQMRFGGNTACVQVTLGDGEPVILDAGTGIRPLGRHLIDCGIRKAHLLLTHFHWDHIQGLPFFDPLYHPDYELSVWSTTAPERVREILELQMSAPYFPVNMHEKPRRPHYAPIAGGEAEIGGIQVTVFGLNHPGGATGYRLDASGTSIVYATDHEPGSGELDEALLLAAEGADVLIIDSQYTPDEHVSRQGWGHGTWLNSARAAKQAGVKRLILFHHDPMRDDAAVEEFVMLARSEFSHTEAAQEGQTIEL